MRRSPNPQRVQPRGFGRALVLLLTLCLAPAALRGAPLSVQEVNRILQTASESVPRAVTFRGVVTHWEESSRIVFLQTGPTGIMVRIPFELPLPKLGDEMEIESTIKFAGNSIDAAVEATMAKVVDHPGVVPPFQAKLLEVMRTMPMRRAVEVDAVVLHVSKRYGAVWLMLTDETATAMAGVFSTPAGWNADELVGKNIRFSGVTNGASQMPLRCVSPDQITLLDTTPPSDTPAPITSSAGVTSAPTDKPRPVILRGVCTFTSPTRKYCTLHDGQSEVLVTLPRFSPPQKPPERGEEATISGVTMLHGSRPQVEAWTIDTLEHAKVVPPARLAFEFSGKFFTVAEAKAKPLVPDRIMMRGVTTYVARSGLFTVFTLHDSTDVTYVYGPGALPFQPLPQVGDRLEVEAVHATTNQFNEATWRIAGHEPIPAAKVVSIPSAMDAALDGRRVRLHGRMVDYETFVERGMNVSRIWLREGDVVTYGNYIGPDFMPAPARIGQMVELDGVCNVGRIAPNVVRSFFVQLNSMSDARVLPNPPVWRDPETLRYGTWLALALAAAGVWVLVLQRQVRLRTARLAQSEADLREALEREQELGKLKTAFVSMVSHEFRTPLNIIATSADILARYLERLLPEERTEHFRSIQSSVKRMSGMMEDVLLLGRLEGGRQKFHPEDLHLPTWCNRFVDEMRSATSERCPIELTVGQFDPMIRADENILRHILANLVSNAVKYSEPGSTVKMSVSREHDDAVFTVEDHGIGIPQPDQERLFEAFRRGHNVGNISGAGLGLVVVKRGVELHGGTVEFTSEEGKNTVFTVRLPLFNMTTTRPEK